MQFGVTINFLPINPPPACDVAFLQNFDHFLLLFTAGDMSTFLTVSEKQRIIRHELESIHALPNDFRIPSMPKVRLYSDEAISLYLFYLLLY